MKYLLVILFMMLAINSTGCDDSEESSSPQKWAILETIVFTPSKLTVDVELLQTQGIVQFETVLLEQEVTQIGFMLYAEDSDWRIKDGVPTDPKYPHQLSQFLFKYNGYLIDTRLTITLIRVGVPS